VADALPYRQRPDEQRPMGMLLHKRHVAMFRTRKSQAEFLRSVQEDPLTRESNLDPFPYPPPPEGAPFLYTVGGEAPLQLRRYAGPVDMSSPIVEFHFEDEAGSTLVRVEFCPFNHPWGPPMPDQIDLDTPVVYVMLGLTSRFGRLLGRALGRRTYRHQFIALIDRHCIA
jgi:hypothetical protein